MKHKKGQAIMINLLLFMMALAVMVMFISPMKSFLDIAQQSDNLNCPGYIHNGEVNDTLSYNSSLNVDRLPCLALKLYLPYIFLVFLIAGVGKLLYERGTDFFGSQ
jgi:hypothetical protein